MDFVDDYQTLAHHNFWRNSVMPPMDSFDLLKPLEKALSDLYEKTVLMEDEKFAKLLWECASTLFRMTRPRGANKKEDLPPFNE